MQLLPLHTPLLHPSDPLADILLRNARLQDRDIVVVSSKAVATVENEFIDLHNLEPSAEAEDLARVIKRSAAFAEAVLRECNRWNGSVIRCVPGAALTELYAGGISSGSILIANAGLDESNAPLHTAIGWPRDPVQSIRILRQELELQMQNFGIRDSGFGIQDPSSRSPNTEVRIACVLTDSVCTPRRSGVTAIALAVSGIDPLQSQIGKKDLFEKPLSITTEAVADQLATAANFVMGNSAQSIPGVIVRDHGLELSDWEGWVPGIRAEEDLFGDFSRSSR